MKMKNPSVEEAIVKAKMLRKKAEEVIHCFLKQFVVIQGVSCNPEFFRDYVQYMVQSLELLFKVLSGDWRTHNVANMYKKIFDKEYTQSDLLDYLEQTIKDQKYLWQPELEIIKRMEFVEQMYDDLLCEVQKRHLTANASIVLEMPQETKEFLANNAYRFYRPTFSSKEFSSLGCTTEECHTRMHEIYKIDLANIKFNLDNFYKFPMACHTGGII